MVASYAPGADWHVGQPVGVVVGDAEVAVERFAVGTAVAMLLLQEYQIGIPSAVLPTSEERSNRRPTRRTHEEHMGKAIHPSILRGHRANIPHTDGPRCVAPVLVNRYRIDRSRATEGLVRR